jgi:hypothetical protein
VDSTTSEKDWERLAKESGIKGTPILARVPGISIPDSFPTEFMHLVFINLVDALWELYSMDYKGLGDEDEVGYQVSTESWQAIGRGTKAAGDTIPSSFGRRVHNIAEEKEHRTAEMRSVWLMYIGPSQLKGQFKNPKIYTHFLQLVQLVRECISLDGISSDTVKTIRAGFADWVKFYEL